jgi:predicted metal-dependent peptidase
MGSEELSMALSLMQDLQRADRDIRITIIESDAAVGKVYEVGPSSEIDPRFTGRGGTDFNPALVEAKDHEPDVVFYYTDGYAPPPEVESRVAVPFAWLITPRGTVPDENWGHVIKLQDICG